MNSPLENLPDNYKENLKENLRFLEEQDRISSFSPGLLDFLSEPEENWQNNLALIGENGFEKNGIRFHSRRDPQKEASRQFKEACSNQASHLVFLSAGLGYIIREALADPALESLLILEVDPEVLFYMLCLTPFSKSGKDIHIHFCPSPQTDTLEALLPFFRNKNLKHFGLYKHRASFLSNETGYAQLEDQLWNIMNKRSINQATLIKFQSLWNKNIALNIRQITEGGTMDNVVKALKTKVKNIVICGAGPSLQESLGELKKYRKKFFLLCADTAFIPLAKSGILPDIVISADPQWLNHYFTLIPEAAQCLWLMDPVLCYHSSHYLEGVKAHMAWWDNPFYLDQLIRQETSRGEIAHGGSVSTNAFDFALKLEAPNIILVGQDLSFSHKMAHVKGATLESMLFFKNNRFKQLELHNFFQLNAIEPRKVNSTIIPGDALMTNDKLTVFIEWFQSQAIKLQGQPKVPQLYNSTKRGVLLKGFVHKPLGEILENQPQETIPLSFFTAGKNETAQKSLSDLLEKILRDCRKLELLYKNNYHLSRQKPAQDQNRKLNRNDEEIKKYDQANQILAVSAQHIILKITENSDANENSQTLFYGYMYLSAKKMSYLLKKMLSITG